MYTEVALSELERLLLSAIPTDEFVSRKEIATIIGKPFLNWHDVAVLNGLVKRGLITEEKRKIGFVKTAYFYRA